MMADTVVSVVRGCPETVYSFFRRSQVWCKVDVGGSLCRSWGGRKSRKTKWMAECVGLCCASALREVRLRVGCDACLLSPRQHAQRYPADRFQRDSEFIRGSLICLQAVSSKSQEIEERASMSCLPFREGAAIWCL